MKSSALAEFSGPAPTFQCTVTSSAVSPVRVTVKVKSAGSPSVLPSSCSWSAIDTTGGAAPSSSLRTVPELNGVSSVVPGGEFGASDRLTRNVSVASTTESPITLKLKLAGSVCSASKTACPEGRTAPTKSEALTGSSPVPMTCQFTVTA